MLTLKDAFLELACTVVNAAMCCDIWWELQNVENPNHEMYRSIAEEYDLFFEANAGAQLVTIIVLLYQAFEKRPDTQNFHHLLKRLRTEEPAAGDLVASLQAQINSLAPTWKKVARARSSAIAQLSNRASSEALMQLCELSPDEIRDLLDQSKKILKRLANYFGILGTAMLDMNARPHTRKLMQALTTPNRDMQSTCEDERA